MANNLKVILLVKLDMLSGKKNLNSMIEVEECIVENETFKAYTVKHNNKDTSIINKATLGKIRRGHLFDTHSTYCRKTFIEKSELDCTKAEMLKGAVVNLRLNWCCQETTPYEASRT